MSLKYPRKFYLGGIYQGPTDVGAKKNFVPRVTLGTILNQQNLQLL